MTCAHCGAENRAGRKFCLSCGAALATPCPACGSENEPAARFCGECGGPLAAAGARAMDGEQRTAATNHQAERRVVSVLFADLVGFTSLSEQRDPEEVREFLSGYFEQARRLVQRYGGTVEKFIGDAVMAVWGTPVAQETDAELAVRAAFDLVAAVTALGEEFDIAGLRVRAGVATGEAAVNLAAEGQGMVAGDLVNTASRVQSAAAPGTVLVDERTRRLSEAAISYEDTGSHALKGKAEPVQLWRAVQVVAARGGSGRSAGLEAPFVGRYSEFRLVRELFHASADERRARLVSVTGVAGIGKSRLAWEFYKYIDGLADDVWWHRGHCLAYGEGVGYWALAEMVRMRGDIAEEEPSGSAREKLRETVERQISDPDEADWVDDRLAQLLGLSEHAGTDREDLFAAWRRFFERLADEAPVVLVFEDLQWADPSLLDFIEYLLEWSRAYPIYVLTLARPDLADKRVGWGAGKRDFHSLFLEPLGNKDVDALLAGLVPGLPAETMAAIGERAEGVPLYAVETVRMLLDRRMLVPDGPSYRPAGPIDVLAVPESLHALIAARLDGLEPDERHLVQHASVLGKSFTKRALSAVSGQGDQEIEPLLAALVRKEVLGVRAEPRSPERGQYGFLQGLMQKVARDTLARRERKQLHLRAARFLESEWAAGEDEIVEVMAAHYLDAYEADRQAEDAPAIVKRAGELLIRAGRRAQSLGANVEAEQHFASAAKLTDDPRTQADLLARAGQAALAAGRIDQADTHFGRASALAHDAEDLHLRARVTAHIAEVFWLRGNLTQAIELMEDAFTTVSEHERDLDLATLATQLGRFHIVAANYERGLEVLDIALEIAESWTATDLISEALNSKALAYASERPQEGIALLEQARKLAVEHDHVAAMLRAYNNLGHVMLELSRYADGAAYLEQAVALARGRGYRGWQWAAIGGLIESLHYLGRWDEAVEHYEQIPEDAPTHGLTAIIGGTFPVGRIATARGEAADLARRLEGLEAVEADMQEWVTLTLVRAILARSEGRYADALALGDEACAVGREARLHFYSVEAWVEAVESALALGDLDGVRERIAQLDARPPVQIGPYLAAHRARLTARVNPDDGEEFTRAVTLFREIGARFWLGVALLEQSEWLYDRDDREAATPGLAEATAIFEELRARPWLERALALVAPEGTPAIAAAPRA